MTESHIYQAIDLSQLEHLVAGRAAILGDAAHAMTACECVA